MGPDRHDTQLHRSIGTDGLAVTAGWVEAADGAGGREWVDPGAGAPVATGMVPYFIASGDTFTVPEFKQALFTMTIDNEGILDVEGFLLEVD